MKSTYAIALAGCLSLAGIARSQSHTTPLPATTNTPCNTCNTCNTCAPCAVAAADDQGLTYWGSVDYLLWFVSKSPLPTPLVTRGGTGIPGDPGVSVLYGGGDVDYGAFSGFRFGLGGWIDPDRLWGIDASGFFLFQENQGFEAESDLNGTPSLYQPVVIPGIGPASYYAAFPGVAAGSIGTELNFRFYGWEVNGMRNLIRSQGLQVDALLGYRSLRLSEQLRITSRVRTLVDGAVDFVGAPVGANALLLTTDSFGASSDVYAPQIGAHVNYCMDRFSFDLTTKVGLGCVNQQVDINGATTLYPPNFANQATQTVPGGILATSTNSPGGSSNRFVVVPEVAARASVFVTEMIRFSVGYSFLYVSDVARPGRQIDPVVNPNNVPSDQDFGRFVGPARPALAIQHSSFWAHGVNFGVEICY